MLKSGKDLELSELAEKEITTFCGSIEKVYKEYSKSYEKY